MVSINDSSIMYSDIVFTNLKLYTASAGLFVLEVENSTVKIHSCQLSFNNVTTSGGFGLILSSSGQKNIEIQDIVQNSTLEFYLSCGENCGILFGQLHNSNVNIKRISLEKSGINFMSTTDKNDSGVLGGTAKVYKKFALTDVSMYGVKMTMPKSATACFA